MGGLDIVSAITIFNGHRQIHLLGLLYRVSLVAISVASTFLYPNQCCNTHTFTDPHDYFLGMSWEGAVLGKKDMFGF